MDVPCGNEGSGLSVHPTSVHLSSNKVSEKERSPNEDGQ